MRLETRIEVLQCLSDDQWSAILEQTYYLPHPGHLIVVPEVVRPMLRPWLPIDPEDEPQTAWNKGMATTDRRHTIMSKLARGMTRAAIARELGVSPGLITKILKGERR